MVAMIRATTAAPGSPARPATSRPAFAAWLAADFIRWHHRHSVWMFSGPHDPPPASTGTMWSASQNVRRYISPGRVPFTPRPSRAATARWRVGADRISLTISA